MTEEKAPQEKFLVRLRKAEDDVTAVLRSQGALKEDLAGLKAELLKSRSASNAITKSVESLVTAVNTLRAKVDAQEEKDEEPALAWLTIQDPTDATFTMEALEKWLDLVLAHYPNGILKDCWRRHGYVVEELIVLQEMYLLAWGPKGQPRDRAEWHSRYLPDTMKRINGGWDSTNQADYGNCGGLESHQPKREDMWVRPEQLGLDKGLPVVGWWVSEHGMTQDPKPTSAALKESRKRLDTAELGELS